MFFNSWWGDRYDGNDPYNEYSNRDYSNTPAEEYNCAGFALDTYSWYCPYDEEDTILLDFDYENPQMPFIKTACTITYVMKILNDFPDVRLIFTLDDVREDEYAIAFRVGDDDFHFFKQIDDNLWAEKRGGEEEIYYHNDESLFEKWSTQREKDRYDWPVVLFAKKRRV